MEKQSNSVGSLFEKAGEYLETRIELTKLKTIDSASDFAASVLTKLVFFFVLALALVIGSIGLSYWVGDLLGKTYYGFFIVTGIYLLILLLVSINKYEWIRNPLHGRIIRKMLK